jgi:uncharacterized membrane protein
MPTPRQLSRDLRLGESPDLTRRRWIVGLSLLGTAAGQLVGLFQTGIVPRLPDPPSDLFDSSRVDASDYAYSRLQTPDAFVMIATYAVTAGLAAAGGKDRAREQPWLPIATLAKTLYDSFVTLKLAREEWDENRAFCAYCQAATVASLASVALAVLEAVEAVRNLTDDGRAGDGRERAYPVG